LAYFLRGSPLRAPTAVSGWSLKSPSILQTGPLRVADQGSRRRQER
jgi:hypothetical protein